MIQESFFLMDNWDPYLNFILALVVFVLSVGAAGKYLPYCRLVGLLIDSKSYSKLFPSQIVFDLFDHYPRKG